MPVNFAPIFPILPVIGIAAITSPGVIVSRATISGNTGLSQLVPTSTNGKRVDRIQINAVSNTAAGLMWVWLKDGSNSYLIDEIPITAVNGTNTAASFTTSKDYTNLVLPNTYNLWVSFTVSQNCFVYAYGGDY